MLKVLTTLIRGAAAEAEEAAFDRNATRLLAQQLRDAATTLELAKKELACAMAHRTSEARAAAMLTERIDTLEQGAAEALLAERLDLAEEAATIIASAEDERADRQSAVDRFDTDIARLRTLVDDGQRRLRDLSRGLELARAQEALNRAGANGRRALRSGVGALSEAEATLERIRKSHAHSEDTAAALDELERLSSAASLDQRLAEAGFGGSRRVKPREVLDRIRAKAATAPAPLNRPHPHPRRVEKRSTVMNQASPRPVRIRSVTPPATHPVAPSHTGTPKMSTNPSLHLPTAQANTAGWVTFTYASFATAAFMTGLGIWALPADLWVKGYMAMAALFLCGATFTLAKTVRDEHEAKRFANRIEEAKTEKLLMEMHRG